MDQKACQNCLQMLWDMAWKTIENQPGLGAIVEGEIDAISKRNPETMTANVFLHEYTWSVFGVGISIQKVLEPRWAGIRRAFGDFDISYIVNSPETVLSQIVAPGVRVLNVSRKAKSVIVMACEIQNRGWDAVKADLLHGHSTNQSGMFIPSNYAIQYLDDFPQVGTTVAKYILKNVGFDIDKDDLHLKRYACHLGYPDSQEGVHEMCADIALVVKSTVREVDTVLWNASAKADRGTLRFDCPQCYLHFELL